MVDDMFAELLDCFVPPGSRTGLVSRLASAFGRTGCAAGIALASLVLASPTLADDSPPLPTFLKRQPIVLTVAQVGSDVDSGLITDVEAADFDGDGRNDLAVAWFLTDTDNPDTRQRFLTFFFGEGVDSFVRGPDIDLYVPNAYIDELSIFRHGCSEIGVGDFDGDGDPDLAVLPYFGDEIWLIENLGNRQFASYRKYPFGINTSGNPITPPEALAADFDGDGRDELVYIADPIQHIQGAVIHFWKTNSTIASMHRTTWEGIDGGVLVQWTRGLAIGDFDADGRPDLCFTGSVNPPNEDDPALVVWHDLDMDSGEFAVEVFYPSFLCSDVLAYAPAPGCPPGLVLTDLDGTQIEFWRHDCDGGVAFTPVGGESGYAGYSTNFGVAGVMADIDGDGDLDLITRQKVGGVAAKQQVEITLTDLDGQVWTRVSPSPISSAGLYNDNTLDILRPRAIAVADLMGNTLPEIAAGFGISPGNTGEKSREDDDTFILPLAIWQNSCVGDVNRDGVTNISDIAAVIVSMNGGGYDPDADLTKDGVVDLADLNIVLGDYDCDSTGEIDPNPQ